MSNCLNVLLPEAYPGQLTKMQVHVLQIGTDADTRSKNNPIDPNNSKMDNMYAWICGGKIDE